MTKDTMLDETLKLIRGVLARPAFYYDSPYAVEAFMEALLGVAIALETGDPLGRSLSRTWEEVKHLTKEVPGNPGCRRYLCEEQIVPERSASNQMLMRRGPELCARLLKSWHESNHVTATKSSEEAGN